MKVSPSSQPFGTVLSNVSGMLVARFGADRLSKVEVVVVPPILIFVCLGVMVIIGAAAMVYALIRISKPANPDDKSNISIPIPGLGKIELGGPSWLILFAVGALMVAFPALVVFAQQTPKTTTPGITDQKVQQAERLIEENVSSFQFVSDLSILDLRQSQETPWYVPIRALFSKDAKQFIKPAILRNVMVVKRRTAAKDSVSRTAPQGLCFRCLSHAATYQENKEPQWQANRHMGGNCRRELRANE